MRRIKKLLAGACSGIGSKWPFRSVRQPFKFTLPPDNGGSGLDSTLRQIGYTTGDEVVVMLSRDFQRVVDLAHTKVRGTVHSISLLSNGRNVLSKTHPIPLTVTDEPARSIT